MKISIFAAFWAAGFSLHLIRLLQQLHGLAEVISNGQAALSPARGGIVNYTAHRPAESSNRSGLRVTA
jgi:hypothetical protein